MSKQNGRTAQPRKRAGDSSVGIEIFISEDEEFYMEIEPHMHASEVGKKLELESVHININTENIDFALSLPIQVFIKLVMMGIHYKKSRQPIVSIPDGSFRIGDIPNQKKVSEDNFLEETIREFLSPAKLA